MKKFAYSLYSSAVQKRSNGSARLIIATIMGTVFGFFIGVSFPSVSNKIKLSSRLVSLDGAFIDRSTPGKSLINSGSLSDPKCTTGKMEMAPHGSRYYRNPSIFHLLLGHTSMFFLRGGSILLFLALNPCVRLDLGILSGLDFGCCAINVSTNPRGAEMLPPGIVVPETDFYLRRLWGEPSE
ncbi:hypothetical protein KSS87_017290, partial [Heliosperma pusillum]